METEPRGLSEHAKRAVIPVSLTVIALLLITAAIDAVLHLESRRYLTLWTGAPARLFTTPAQVG